MATLLAPYNAAMQLGQGFNSFTQQLCIDNAVLRDEGAAAETGAPMQEDPRLAQSVYYRLTKIEKATDVTNAMNISPAFAIKYDAFNAKGKGDSIDTTRIKESDINFMVQVKCANQVIQDSRLTKFNPIAELKGQPNFADVYGDCFISGFQYGGEFTAVISIRVNDRAKVESVKANAAINLTNAKLEAELDGGFSKEVNELLRDNETTITVAYTGGGQDLKADDEDWNFETMRQAALKFPTLVAKTPIRTHAVLSKYTALRSFYLATLTANKGLVLNYEQAGLYSTFLQEAFLDYKSIAKNLQVLSYDVSSGTHKLVASPVELAQVKVTSEPSRPIDPTVVAAANSESDSDTVVVKAGASGVKSAWLSSVANLTRPFPPTIKGIEDARTSVRQQMNAIAAEVDAVAKDPAIATDPSREQPFTSAPQFRSLLPTGEPLAAVTAASTSSPQQSDKGMEAPPNSEL